MRKLVIAALVLLSIWGLGIATALIIQQTAVLTFAGVFLVTFTVVVADLVTTGLRRRARRTPLPVLVKPAPAEAETTAPSLPVSVEPEEELWLPPLSEPGEEMWVIPAIPEAEKAQETAPSRVSPADLVGRKIGPYEVLEKIGQGGMATVYKGFHPGLQRPVAIKVLAESLTATPELAQRFRREAQTIAALRHPHIVQVYDFGPLGDSHYLAMEYVEGSDLQAEMARRREEKRPFTSDEILHLLGRVAKALDYAHSQGVIHRDVKPGNVLLAANGQPILTDFGLATLRRTRATLITTIGQNVLGTPEYTAPEQALDAQAAGPQSDVYSLGCILYEMVTGRLPFEAESALSIALMHIGEEPTPPSQHAPDLPEEVEAVILQAMAKKPEERFPTAGEMVNALRQAWKGET